MSWVWDQHTCLPLDPDADVAPLTRYRPGYLSVNVGYTPQSKADSLALLASFRAQVAADPRMELATDPAGVERAVSAGRIAVAFDLEDSGPLGGSLDSVREFVELGVRTLLPSYNHTNAAGCGCLDAVDTGLTAWGRDLVRAMNAAGMVPDGSHCSARTGLDMCAVSTKPVVYSHSCLKSVWDHPRNITDDQARACAETGGVVGITGVGIFLGPNTPTVEAMIRHLEAAVELVGIDHVGVSTDFSFDAADFLREVEANPELFDASYTRWGTIRWMPPEEFLTLGPALLVRGWSPADVTAVLSGNFLRVARESW
ncbi:dipeptidase [Sporichthya brevicatena]|uniref:Dipeptidase n=1 Tax=Sporichthya brevicatena TaxID=171442 RepID=A0ABN1GXJ2_9ACTN